MDIEQKKERLKMAEAWFEYNGINSKDMNIKIENDVSFPSPEADIEFVEVLGKDGELAIDNNRLKGVKFSLPIQLRTSNGVSVNDQATDISEWLKGEIGWFPLKFSGQPDFDYIAICYEQFDIKETLKSFGKTVITFRLKPTKIRNDSTLTEIQNGNTLTNARKKATEPYIKITGTGNIIVQNNGLDWLILTGIEEYIEIDSEVMTAYKNDLLQNDKMNGLLTPMFPLLESGDNVITWTGTVTKFEIHTRWGAIV